MASSTKTAPGGSVREIEQAKGKNAIASIINERYELARRPRQPFEREWLVNVAFRQGRQYIYYDTTLNRLVEPEQPEWQVRITINRIRPIINSLKAKVQKTRPMLQVVPNTTDDEDISAAKLGGKFLESAWRDFSMDEREDELMNWAFDCGMSFAKVYWDATGGEYVEQPRLIPSVDPMTGQEVYLDSGQVDKFWTGDIRIDTVPAFEIFPDPTATNLDNCAWMIHAKWRPLDWIRNNFPGKGNEVAAESNSAALDYAQALLAGINGVRDDRIGVPSGQEGTEGAVVKEYWEKPNKVHPKGRLITVANDVVLQDEELPLPEMGFPFVAFYDIEEPGRFWGTSHIKDLIPLQVEYNKTRSQALENKNLMQRPKWLVRNGSLVDETMALTDEPGEVVFFSGDAPQAWVPPAAPDYGNLLDQINYEFMELSGQHEVSKGSPVSSNMPGIAIQLLQEADDTKLGPIIRRYHRSLEEVGSKILMLAGAYYEEPRLVKTVGRTSDIDIDQFTGADLNRNYDVRIEMGDALSGSVAAKRQFVIDLWGLRLFGPYASKQEEEAAKKVLAYLEFGNYDQQFDDTLLDESNAKQENADLLEGVMPQRQPYDNDEIHIENHDRALKQGVEDGVIMAQVPGGVDPMTGQMEMVEQPVSLEEALLIHREQHIQAINEAMMAQQQAMMIQQGGIPPTAQQGGIPA